MSFRLKTILGIALIEGVLLIVLVVNSLLILRQSNEEQLFNRARTAATLFATTSKDAVLSTDLATLNTFADAALNNPGVVYLRVRGFDQVLAEAGDPLALKRTFSPDKKIADITDGILDASAEIDEAGTVFGQVEIGFSIARMTQIWNQARKETISIALLEMILVAIFSAILGGLLTRQLSQLKTASIRIAEGDIGYQVQVRGNDELAHTSAAFNHMSNEIKNLYQKMESDHLRLNSIMDTVLDGIVTINEKGIIESVNPATRKIFGYNTEEMSGKNVSMLMSGANRSNHDAYISNYLKTGLPNVIGQNRVVEGMRCNGEVFPLELSVSEMILDEQRIFVGVLRDKTEAVKAEEMMRYAKEQAESASKAKSDFLAVMSHEIRTPMNAILGSLSILDDGKLDDEQKLYLRNAEQAGQAMLWLINDILDYSKIEAGKLSLEETRFDVLKLVEEVVDVMAVKALEKGIELSSYVEPGIEKIVVGDPGRLRQILLNLLSNAIKFTKQGGACVSVKSGTNQQLTFEVEDSGIGIDPDKQDILFKEFEQIDSTYTREYGGTGLGLAISSRLVKLMGGEIKVESVKGSGSKFWFSIKFISTAEASVIETPATLPNRVLLSEPNVMTQQWITQQLAAWGVEVELLQPSENMAFLEWVDNRDKHRAVLKNISSGSVDSSEMILHKPIHHDKLLLLLSGNDRTTQEQNQKIVPKPHPREGQGKRILLADDSHANQLVAATMLERAGYEVDTVADGSEALEIITKVPYDLVLMDVSMPIMDGLTATKLIRKLADGKGNLPILAMTANATKDDKQRCMAAGMNGFIGKPVERLQLLETIAEHLQPHNLENTSMEYNQDHQLAESELFIDYQVLKQLEEDIGTETIPQMMAIYFQENSNRFNRLLDACQKEDLDALESEAHALKGSFGTLGMLRVQELAIDLETACRGGNKQLALQKAQSIPDRGRKCFLEIAKHYNLDLSVN